MLPSTLSELPEGVRVDSHQVFPVAIPEKPSGRWVLSVRVRCSYLVQSRSFVVVTKFGTVIVLHTLIFDDD